MEAPAAAVAAGTSSGAFHSVLHSVVIGIRQLDQFSNVLVTSATEDALLCVARDYGHDYAALLRKYRDDVVRRHASGTLSDLNACQGTTKSGKRCGKRALMHGYCSTHAAEHLAEQHAKRNVQAYQARVKRPADPDVALMELFLGRNHVPGDRFVIRPTGRVL